MKKQHILTVASTMILLAATSGCAGSSEPATFNTVDELKDAYVAAGGECTDWEIGTATGKAAQFGNCDGDAATLSTYTSEAVRDEVLSELKENNQSRARSFVGPNWIITTNAPEEIGLKLNATIVNLKS